MKLVLSAVMYSPNLGDGLIAECLTCRLQAADPQVQVGWLDLAGRTVFAAPSGMLRTRVLDILARLPSPASAWISRQLVNRQIARHLAPKIPTALDEADAVIVGGGQLLADANLNFPLKLLHLTRAAQARGLPIALHAVGVSGSWTPHGLRLFSTLLTSPNLAYISVRDTASAENLRSHYHALGVPPPTAIKVFPDPGLCADALNTPPFCAVGGPPQIGLGIIHPAALRTHSDDGRAPTLAAMIQHYRAVADALVAHGADVHLFTNGGGEDEQMLDAVMQSLPPDHPARRVPRANTPRDLTRFIAGMHAIAAHRLHACIAAHATGRLAVGFRWDHKMKAYFQTAGQTARLLDWPTNANAVAQSLLDSLNATELARLDALKPQVDEGVRDCLAGLMRNSAGRAE